MTVEPPDLEYTRAHGQIVLSGHTDTGEPRAVVETTKEGIVFFVAVILNDDGSIRDFAPRVINRYVSTTLAPDAVQENRLREWFDSIPNRGGE